MDWLSLPPKSRRRVAGGYFAFLLCESSYHSSFRFKMVSQQRPYLLPLLRRSLRQQLLE